MLALNFYRFKKKLANQEQLQASIAMTTQNSCYKEHSAHVHCKSNVKFRSLTSTAVNWSVLAATSTRITSVKVLLTDIWMLRYFPHVGRRRLLDESAAKTSKIQAITTGASY
jgi:hypothetical protein